MAESVNEGGTRTCPECGTTVPAGAHRCAACRYRFSYSAETLMTRAGWVFVALLLVMVAAYYLMR